MSRAAVAATTAAACIAIIGFAVVAVSASSNGGGEDAGGGGWQMGSVPGTLTPEQQADLRNGATLGQMGVTEPPSPPALTLDQRRALEGKPSHSPS